MSSEYEDKKPIINKTVIEKKIIFTAYQRCYRVIIIFAINLILLSAVSLFTDIWGEVDPVFLVFNAVTLINLTVISVLYFKNRIFKAENVSFKHQLIQNAAAGSLIIWGAVVTALDTSSIAGYATYIICLLTASGLLLQTGRTIIFMFFTSYTILHAISVLSGRPIVIKLYIEEAVILWAVLYVALAINRINKQTLNKSFKLEEELEDKVRQRTAELLMEKERAVHSEKLKSLFLANMSHEIRTPLNGILGFSNLILSGGVSAEESAEFLEIIIKSGNNLLSVLNEILEISRLEAGACEVFVEDFDLDLTMKEVCNSFSYHQKILANELELGLRKAGTAGRIMVSSDRGKVIEIAGNLVGNALKFTDQGSILIEYGLYDGGSFMISVADTGIGIRDEEKESIFREFLQLNRSSYSAKEGVGLGLSIVRGYVELLGGSLSVESEYGNGSCFTVILPLTLPVKSV